MQTKVALLITSEFRFACHFSRVTLG